MESPGRGPTITPSEALRVFERLDDPRTPLTSAEVADELGCPRRTASTKLEELAEQGTLRSKEVGARGRIWWRPSRAVGSVVHDARTDEVERHRERDLLDRTLESVPVSISVIDTDGAFVRANSRAIQRLGLDATDPSRNTVWSWELYDDAGEPIPREEHPYTRTIETGTPIYDYQCQVDLPTEGRRWLSINTIPTWEDEEGGGRIIISVDDITDLKEREQQLQAEHDQTHELLKTAPIAISVQDADGTTQLANQRAQDLLGLSEHEILEEPENIDEWGVYDAEGDPLDPAEMPAARVRTTGEPVFDEEILIERPGGESMWTSVNAAPVFGPDGALRRVITTGEDVTQRKAQTRQLERQRNELESELDEVFDRVTDAFYALDAEWRFTHVNERAEETFQRAEEELLGKTVWDAFPEARETLGYEKFREAMDTQKSVSYREHYPPFSSWFEIRLYPSDTGLSVYFTDVTERVERERALAESEQRYRALAENVPNGGVNLYDDELRYTLVAGQAFDDVGVSLDDVEGRTLREVYGDDVADAVEPAYRAALDGESGSVEVAFADREWVIHTVPVADESGDVSTGMAMAQDITERKQFEQTLTALHASSRDLLTVESKADVSRVVLDTAVDVLDLPGVGIYLYDETDEVLRPAAYSDYIAEMFGELPEFSIGSGDSAITWQTFVDGETITFDDVRETDLAYTQETPLRSGIWIPLGDHGVIALVSETVEAFDRDAHKLADLLAATAEAALDRVEREHERQEYERQLETTVEELERSNAELQRFAYVASHDLKEPLRMVSSYVTLLERRYGDQLDGEAHEFIEFAVDGAARMRAMVEGLLQYSRVDQNTDELEPIDCNAILEEARKNLQVKIAESDAEITIEPLPTVHGDEALFVQLFQNLLSNAITYAGDEPPRVHVSAEERETGRGTDWVFSVRDEGIGIDPEDTDRIFEVFNRLHSNEEYPGTGIGLSLCRKIAERHGGDVSVESEVGEGTTFYVTLPSTGASEQ